MDRGALARAAARLKKTFPDRQILVRTHGEVHYFTLSHRVQLGVCAAALAGVLATGALGVHLGAGLSTPRTATLQQGPDAEYAADLARLEAERGALREEIARLRARSGTALAAAEERRTNIEKLQQDADARASRVQDLQEELNLLRARIAASEAAEQADTGRIAGLEKTLADAQNARRAAETQLARARAEEAEARRSADLKIAALEQSLGEREANIDRLRADYRAAVEARQAAEARLRTVTQERDEALQKVKELGARVSIMSEDMSTQLAHTGLLESELKRVSQQISSTQHRKASEDSPRNAAEVSEMETRLDTLMDVQRGLIAQLESSAEGNLSMLEGVIERTGLKVGELLNSLEPTAAALGGPFMDLSEMRRIREINEESPEFSARINRLTVKLNRLSWLRIALNSLPLAVPVEEYRLTSRFGYRKDPFTKRSAFHSGLDFAAARGTPVHSTAPGKVVHAGRKGAYGRFVEIDHGHGITTRYAHLDSISVEVGDEVGYMQAIGKMGTSGRSTGVHLHYEVTFNGEFYDPEDFIKAGRDVFKVQQAAASGTGR
ncbi:peptidoglycan DD-metalloendopeptidase family protein [Futiania mangrovi]|uniref:Peptidoglycan DD-metalloendopeptidase family protein n=1 Tax=Futiania mangrovi TaxID=2959716 RepID=A0A9J6PGG0_9PROT|nr:peptidoglycan DD-metalloendopeptidase family protein [Futiania mangrovii]MCP1335687.1 peptidoglycan DD-metalloendopeptidase family protein [Futiania mangrovii]